MMNPGMERRLTLLKEFLSEMMETDKQLEILIIEIEKSSETYYQHAFLECREEIRQEIDKYTNNSDRISEINRQITANINLWYEFIKSTAERSKLTFPALYLIRKRNIEKNLKKANDEISSITIDNRFIKEKLTLLEHQLEIKAIQKIKEDKNCADYDRLLAKKEALSAELMYLLPAIPQLLPASVDSTGVIELYEKMLKLETV